MLPHVYLLISILSLCLDSSSSSSSSSNSLVTVVSNCISTPLKNRQLHLYCADGHIHILEAVLGSLENRVFGCYRQPEDCVASVEFLHCEGTTSCDVQVPKQKPLLCTSPINERRRIFSMSAYLQISYECTGKISKSTSTCLKDPSIRRPAAAASATCAEDEHVHVLNVFEGRKSFASLEAMNVLNPSAVCSHSIGDQVFRTPLSASLMLGCNGLNQCRLPYTDVDSAAVASRSSTYLQTYYECLRGKSFFTSRCYEQPPNAEQDAAGGARYVALDCSSSSVGGGDDGVIVIINAFFGSRDGRVIDVSSCAFQAGDLIQETDIKTCEGRRRCYVSLKAQLSVRWKIFVGRHLYLQVHYRCRRGTSPAQPDLMPNESQVSIRDFFRSDGVDRAAANLADSDSVAKRSGGGGNDDIDHTSTIVGGLLLTIAVASSFFVAYLLDRKWKRRQALVVKKEEEDEEDDDEDDEGRITEEEEEDPRFEKNYDEVPKKVDVEMTKSLVALEAMADVRLTSSKSPVIPRKLEDLPEECRNNLPDNVADYIEKGEKREFYV